VRTSGALHRDIYIKKQWLVQAAKGHSQQIHLEIVNPLPWGGQAGAKIWASPNIKAPSYLGVDLRAARPYGERADWTTWPWRHPHGRFSLMKRMNPVAEKSPQGLQPVQANGATPYSQLGWQMGRLLVNVGSSASTSFLSKNHDLHHPDLRVRHQNRKVGINLGPRSNQDVYIA
jgi:hypothetical protein